MLWSQRFERSLSGRVCCLFCPSSSKQCLPSQWRSRCFWWSSDFCRPTPVLGPLWFCSPVNQTARQTGRSNVLPTVYATDLFASHSCCYCAKIDPEKLVSKCKPSLGLNLFAFYSFLSKLNGRILFTSITIKFVRASVMKCAINYVKLKLGFINRKREDKKEEGKEKY